MALHTYTPTEWKNAPDHKTTPVNATNLNHIEDGIADAYTDIAAVQSEAESLIAPIETSSTASQAYSIGEQFIYNGLLYKATAAISSGGTITPNGNCTVSDSITEQINDLDKIVNKGSVSVTADGTKTNQQILNTLFALIDGTKLSARTVLTRDTDVYVCRALVPNSIYYFENTNVELNNFTASKIALSSNGSALHDLTINFSPFAPNIVNQNNNTPSNGTKFTIYY